MPAWHVRSVSFSKNLAAVEWCKKNMALELFEETLIFQKTIFKRSPRFGMDQALQFLLHRFGNERRHLNIIQCVKTHVNVSSKLWEAWKKGDHCMGKNVRKYEPTPEEVPDQHKLSDFQFKLVQVECTNPKAKDFVSKYKVNLPSSIRSRYLA